MNSILFTFEFQAPHVDTWVFTLIGGVIAHQWLHEEVCGLDGLHPPAVEACFVYVLPGSSPFRYASGFARC